MIRRLLLSVILSVLAIIGGFAQEKALRTLLADPAMKHASVSVSFRDVLTGRPVFEYEAPKALNPASVVKLATAAAAFSTLGRDYTFGTVISYTGTIDAATGRLSGDIIITGGGDPALGSRYFTAHYGDVIDTWVKDIRKAGIRSITGRIITDDSRYGYGPVPGRWLWEDLGNYYGAGVYGLSVFDNMYEIHLRTSSEGSGTEITKIVPVECSTDLDNKLVSSGSRDMGYVFAAPYGNGGWMAGSVPANREDFVLKASVTDPPLLAARMLGNALGRAGIATGREPATYRTARPADDVAMTRIGIIKSPPLCEIIKVMNRESVNLFAEHLAREMALKVRGAGRADTGAELLGEFIAGTGQGGIFIEDASGLSPVNAISSAAFTEFLYRAGTGQSWSDDFITSIPGPGDGGTLGSLFNDPLFAGRLNVKSGSMTRARNYAGYLTTVSGRRIAFCLLISNFTGQGTAIAAHCAAILKEATGNLE